MNTKKTIKVYVDFKPKATEHINAVLGRIGSGGYQRTDLCPSRARRKEMERKLDRE